MSLHIDVFAQKLVTDVVINSRVADGNNYLISCQGRIADGWLIYASDKPNLGLDGLKLKSDNRGIQLKVVKYTIAAMDYKDPLFDNQTLKVFKGKFAFHQEVQFETIVPANINLVLSGFAVKGNEFVEVNDTLNVGFPDGHIVHASPLLNPIDINHPLSDCGINTTGAVHSILGIFLMGFVGGILGLLTPCVFPMIPLTVSWFGAQAVGKGVAIKNGMLYGMFIIIIYLLGSLPFHLLGGISPELLNSLSTNVWVNVVFFLVFVFFALSFFGLFDLSFSGRVSNAVDSRGGLGSVVGIFFMALTLALVSFSCTGPILGSLLVGSLSSASGAWALSAGMGGFGLALGIPFALFAMFPSWMKALPKSGGWLGVFKVSLAFVELGLALKFLSNADLVGHWGILYREVFLGLWLLIALLLAGYLLGMFSGFTRWFRVSFGRIFFAGLVLLFSVYLSFGLFFGTSLEILSGFPPPVSYSIFKSKSSSGVGSVGSVGSVGNERGVKPQFMNDYKAALAMSKKTGKPLMLDFTGWACVNCRKMEEDVWTVPEVAEYIRENFILVSLYVDDRKELPLDEQFMYGKKEIRTVGDLYATMESVNFKQVSQPLYVLLSPDEKLLNSPVGYTPDWWKYLEWLKCGRNAVE